MFKTYGLVVLKLIIDLAVKVLLLHNYKVYFVEKLKNQNLKNEFLKSLTVN